MLRRSRSRFCEASGLGHADAFFLGNPHESGSSYTMGKLSGEPNDRSISAQILAPSAPRSRFPAMQMMEMLRGKIVSWNDQSGCAASIALARDINGASP